ncbi:hypothetical protein BJV82DRAFT_582097 [Fennellomyces sp. T-0311]|nr:hypothetical protein BJV82DRAFT_582097 [Fennellomyces sp. T-0311]
MTLINCRTGLTAERLLVGSTATRELAGYLKLPDNGNLKSKLYPGYDFKTETITTPAIGFLTVLALVLAAAELIRVGLASYINQLSDGAMLYAVSQGALALECHANDTHVLNLLKPFGYAETRLTCIVERAMLRKSEGGCSAPIVVRTTLEGHTLTLEGLVASLDGKQTAQFKDQVALDDASNFESKEAAVAKLETTVGQKLLNSGGGAILKELSVDQKH